MGRAERLQSLAGEIGASAKSVHARAMEAELHKAMHDLDNIRAAAQTLCDTLDESIRTMKTARPTAAEQRTVRHALRNAVHSALGHTEALLDDLDLFGATALREPLGTLRSEGPLIAVKLGIARNPVQLYHLTLHRQGPRPQEALGGDVGIG